MKRMKREHCDIIIRVQKGKFVKLYANGKWQKGVTAIDFHASCRYVDGRFIQCEFENIKVDKNGKHIIKDYDIVREKHVARVR